MKPAVKTQIMPVTITETEVVYRNLGFTDSVTDCDCCGKTDLKGTYAIENLMTGDIMYFGCICAANRMNWSKKEFVTKYKSEEKEQNDAARAEYRISSEMKQYNTWVSNLPDTATDTGWELRMSLLKEEGPAYKNALEVKKIELQAKYPLAKYIY
jgi:hypothetical protein